MTTLKDKEITLPRAIKIAKESNWDTSTKVIPSKNVKEAILLKQTFLYGKIETLEKDFLPCEVFTREDIIRMFKEEIKENREIFGNFEND